MKIFARSYSSKLFVAILYLLIGLVACSFIARNYGILWLDYLIRFIISTAIIFFFTAQFLNSKKRSKIQVSVVGIFLLLATWTLYLHSNQSLLILSAGIWAYVTALLLFIYLPLNEIATHRKSLVWCSVLFVTIILTWGIYMGYYRLTHPVLNPNYVGFYITALYCFFSVLDGRYPIENKSMIFLFFVLSVGIALLGSRSAAMALLLFSFAFYFENRKMLQATAIIFFSIALYFSFASRGNFIEENIYSGRGAMVMEYALEEVSITSEKVSINSTAKLLLGEGFGVSTNAINNVNEIIFNFTKKIHVVDTNDSGFISVINNGGLILLFYLIFVIIKLLLVTNAPSERPTLFIYRWGTFIFLGSGILVIALSTPITENFAASAILFIALSLRYQITNSWKLGDFKRINSVG